MNAIQSASGIDVDGAFESAYTFATRQAPDGTTQLEKYVSHQLKCRQESAFCTDRKDLATEMLKTAVMVGGTVALTSLCTGPFSGAITSIVAIAATISYAPIVIVRTYGLETGCLFRFPPVLPVCLADDIFDILNTTVLAQHIVWPRGLFPGDPQFPVRRLKKNGYPALLMDKPIDCAAAPVYMTDGFAVLVYYLDVYAPTWRRYAPLWTLSNVFGVGVVDSYAFRFVSLSSPNTIAENPETFQACAALMSVNVPLVLITLLVILMLVLVFMQTFLVFLSGCLNTIMDIRMFS